MKRFKELRTMLTLGLAVMALAHPLWAEVPRSWSSEECTQKAEALYRQGNDRGALEYAEAALTKDPKDWKALQIAGYAAFRIGNKFAAFEYLRKSLAMRSDNPPLKEFVEKNFTQEERGDPGYTPDLEPLQSPVLRPGGKPQVPAKSLSEPVAQGTGEPVTGTPGWKRDPAPKLGKDYGFLGLTLGSPGEVNLVGGYFYEDVGGLLFLGHSGLQVELAKTLAKTSDRGVILNLSFVAAHQRGTIRGTESGWFGGSYPYQVDFDFGYFGLGLEFYSGGFFLSGGPAIAEGTGYRMNFLSPPTPRDLRGTVIYQAQFGYLIRLD